MSLSYFEEKGLPKLMPLPYASIPAKTKRRFSLGNAPVWVLTEDWECSGMTVPKGFITDLDSVPRIPLVHSFLKGRSRSAALLHDWMYGNSLNRELADKYFLDNMLKENVNKVQAYMIYWGVRGFGWMFYGKEEVVILD